jgi:hypothetical protein
MNNSNSSSNPSAPRVTLKLKGGARRPADEAKTRSEGKPSLEAKASSERGKSSIPASQGKPNQKPGAHWSDEYKRRMQADMDELTSKSR